MAEVRIAIRAGKKCRLCGTQTTLTNGVCPIKCRPKSTKTPNKGGR